MVLGGVVRDVVPVDDVLQESERVIGAGEKATYVVPVPLALLQGRALELEAAHPAAALLGVLGERKLPGVVIP